MASKDAPTLKLVPSIEIDNELEAEVAQLLEAESPGAWNQSNRPSQRAHRPSLQLLPRQPDIEVVRSAKERSRSIEEHTQNTDPSKLLSVSAAKTPVIKRSGKNSTPTSPLDPSGFLSAGSPQKHHHAKGKSSTLAPSDRPRPTDIDIRPQTSTSQMSGFSLRPFSGIGTRPATSLSIHSSVLAIPDNVRSLMFRAIDRARGIKRRGTPDPLDSPCSSVSDFKVSVVSHGALMKRLDSFYVMKEEANANDNTARTTLWKWKKIRVPSPFGQRKITCNYYIDPHG
jgi:hypothetical protein